MICHKNIFSSLVGQTSTCDPPELGFIWMKRCYKLFVALLCLSASGCSTFSGSDVEVSPVEFVHPDELLKGEGFLVLADRRLFTVMDFINAVGYDSEWEGAQMHPVRIKVREEIQSRLTKEPKIVAIETSKGLNLVRPFYLLSSKFEESSESFENFLPVMLEMLPEYGQ